MKDEKILEQIHKGCLCLLTEFDRVCVDNGIDYSLDSGTLIGAVRHQGFIPWDDDADVALTRDNFQKLILVKDQFEYPFRFVLPTDYENNAFLDTVPRLVLLTSKLQFDNDETEYYGPLVNRLCLDIFIVDDIPKNKSFGYFKKMLGVFSLYGQLMGHRKYINMQDYGMLSRIAMNLLMNIGKHRNIRKLYDKYESICSKKSKTDYVFNSNYGISNTRNYLKVYNKNWFSEYERKKFEDKEFLVFSGYHNILKNQYGDYMKLPTKDQIEVFYQNHSSLYSSDEGFFVELNA